MKSRFFIENLFFQTEVVALKIIQTYATFYSNLVLQRKGTFWPQCFAVANVLNKFKCTVAEMKDSNWLKVVTELETANQSALPFQCSIPLLL